MKYIVLGIIICLGVLMPQRAQADLSGCGVLGGAIAVWVAGSPQGRLGDVVLYLAALGGYEAGAGFCETLDAAISDINPPTGGPNPHLEEQIRQAMCPMGDCATVGLPGDPMDCYLSVECPVALLPDTWISANDFLSAITFINNSIQVGIWPWDRPWDIDPPDMPH